MKTIKRLLLGLLVLADSARTLAAIDASRINEAVKANNEFAADLYAQLDGVGGNFSFSPTSIEVVGAMACAGAAGRTASQLRYALHLSDQPASVAVAFQELLQRLNVPECSECQFSVAASLWGQTRTSFRKDFERSCREFFLAQVRQVDFLHASAAAKREMNAWVTSRTSGGITEIAPRETPNENTVLVMLSALYFKNSWANKFETSATANAAFYLDSHKSVSVPMMYGVFRLPYTETRMFQAVELPYASNVFSLILVLPREHGGLNETERVFLDSKMSVLRQLAGTHQVALRLPKFQVDSTVDMKEALQGLGIKDAFSSKLANFSHVAPGAGMAIEAAIHKSFLRVDEGGTEAGASTYLGIARGEQSYFTADHPFMFLIRHNSTGAIVLMGRLLHPSGQVP